jgi:hypothetical protein
MGIGAVGVSSWPICWEVVCVDALDPFKPCEDSFLSVFCKNAGWSRAMILLDRTKLDRTKAVLPSSEDYESEADGHAKGEMTMATTVPNGNLISLRSARRAAIVPRATAGMRRSRYISPEAGRGIEMLGHAIEYLSDEFALDCMGRIFGTEPGMHPRLLAIEMLKARNREIYLSCPEVPTLKERLWGMFPGLRA